MLELEGRGGSQHVMHTMIIYFGCASVCLKDLLLSALKHACMNILQSKKLRYIMFQGMHPSL